ncbi:AP2-associated protein kinase 1 [Bradysia coprophila]|uniref:AP2-associated protein kinase 1 n=1 Tax=Bradysia coprophila TaxID=38358 RepID=UPI00187DA2B4|nr:AP2-associated protein kinase 1 [Bradysia coprophila]
MITFNGFVVFCTLATLCLTTVMSQDGPLPPRINIPGAIPLGAVPVPIRAAQFASPIPSGPPLVRIRRPPHPKQQEQQHLNAIPTLQRSLDEAKPVNEEPEEEQSFIPHIVQQPQSLGYHQSHDQFSEPPATIPRFSSQDRPSPIQRSQPAQPQPHQEQLFSFVPDRQPSIPESPAKQTYRRPAFREPRPQFEDEQKPQQPVRRVQQEYIRPRTSGEHQQNQEKEKKPVAQILRKYREENEDGSITWGFENDDGSYKEEIIGIDCVTRGRYGYVDPDGMKREYTYETGIQCDPNKRDLEEDDELPGVDYQENAMVFPNGERISLSALAKNKARKPSGQPIYRN